MLALSLPRPGFALDPAKTLLQYNARTWTRQNGLPVNGITALAQTKDGYIWMGSSNGIVRFDGVDFKTIDIGGLRSVRYAYVATIFPARDGGLWVGLENSGFGHFDGRVFSPLSREAWGGEHANVRGILEDDDGRIWVGTPGGVSRIDLKTGGYEVLLRTTDDANYNVLGGSKDQTGRLFFGTVDAGVHLWDHGRHAVVLDDELKHTLAYGSAVNADGDIFVPTAIGVFRYDKNFRRKGTLLRGEAIRALLVDSAGALWIGASSGLYRYWQGQTTTLTDRIAKGQVTALCEDHEGSLWVGTQNGLSQLTDVKFPTLPAATDPKVQEVYAVCASPRGGVWGRARFDYGDDAIASAE